MDTVSETVSKVDEGLQEMGIDGVKDSLKDLLNFKQYMENQVPAVMGFCIKVVLSVIVFFVGRKIIQWILNVMRRSLERANVDAGVIQFASFCRESGFVCSSDHQYCSKPWCKGIFCSGIAWYGRCDGWSGTTGRSCKSGRRSSFVAF